MRMYFEGYIDTNITHEEHEKNLELLSMDDKKFRNCMRKELTKYFSDAYVSNGERLKVTNVRVPKGKVV